ncbi:MAG: nucleotidyltransferase domain-containing protein [Acidimicrobiales bacterium]
MDLTDPTRAVTPTLDGPVLAVLARSGRPLTVGEVAALAVRGSEIGVRKSLSRLVEQGLVRATIMGRNRVHELNRDHVAAQAAEVLADLRGELWRRMRTAIENWEVKPCYACVFGSAARGDGRVDSDIDVLMVHPPLPGDPKPAKGGLFDQLMDALSLYASAGYKPVDSELWFRQLDDFRRDVQQWSGNPLQIVDVSIVEYSQPTDGTAALLSEIRAIKVELFRAPTFFAGV